MKKLLLLFPLCFLLLGCPVYDPPRGYIEISNKSKSIVYVYDTCSDTLPLSPELKLFQSMGGNAYDADGKKMNDTIIPRYKIDPDSLREFRVWGRPEKPQLFCDDNKIRLFFIKEDILKTRKWEDICKFNLYEKKLVFTQSELEKMNWKIVYNP